MAEGMTCYERDEDLCEDQMCLRTGCRLRNERLAPKPPSQWRGGAGGAPILSQPIADYRRFPLGGYRKLSWTDPLAMLALLVALPIALAMKAIGRLK